MVLGRGTKTGGLKTERGWDIELCRIAGGAVTLRITDLPPPEVVKLPEHRNHNSASPPEPNKAIHSEGTTHPVEAVPALGSDQVKVIQGAW